MKSSLEAAKKTKVLLHRPAAECALYLFLVYVSIIIIQLYNILLGRNIS